MSNLTAKPKVNSSISYRSSSVKPSMRSSRSRITLVEYNADLEIKVGTAYGITTEPQEDEAYKLMGNNVQTFTDQITGSLPFSICSACIRSFISKRRIRAFHTQGSQMYDRHQQPSRKHHI
jgi:hypothetical protein